MEKKNKEKKKGNIRIRDHQLEVMLDMMEKNHLLNAKFDNSTTNSDRNNCWIEVKNVLNSLGGAVKDVDEWQRSWTDKKRTVKKKNVDLCLARHKTGGGQVETWKELTPIELRVLKFVGQDACEGLAVEESGLTENVQPNYTSGIWDSFDNQLPDLETPADPSGILDETPVETQEKNPDPRLRSIQFKKKRTKSLILRSSNADKLIEGTSKMAEAITRCAAAMETRNELKKLELELKEREILHRINYNESILTLKKRKIEELNNLREPRR